MSKEKKNTPDRLKTFLKKKSEAKKTTIVGGEKFTNFFASIKKNDKDVLKESRRLLGEDKQLDFGFPVKHHLDFDHPVIKEGRQHLENQRKNDENFEKLHRTLSKHYHMISSEWPESHEHYNERTGEDEIEETGSLHALKDYTEEESGRINRALWNDETHHLVNDIDNSLHHHITPHGFHVYTGINRTPEIAERNHKGWYKLHFKSYTSTSLNHKVAHGFADRTPEGTSHYYHRDGTQLKSEHIEQYNKEQKLEKEYHSEFNEDKKTKIHSELSAARLSPEGRSLTAAFGKHGAVEGYRHILQIHVPEETYGAYVGHVSSHSSEYEHILPRESSVMVHPIPTVHHDTSRVCWHGTLVHDGDDFTEHWDYHNKDKNKENE